MKKHRVTGEDVPDETARVPLERYVNPRKAEWPKADFVVGNPPYLGARTIRGALGESYLATLRETYGDVAEHADFVMYWWALAADRAVSGKIRRFGLITTKSISQEFSRKIVQSYFAKSSTFGFRFAIPNHPWVDASDGADVRVALTVCDNSGGFGQLLTVVNEVLREEGEVSVELQRASGVITADLRLGTDVLATVPLNANNSLSCVGYQISGKGFVVERSQAESLDPRFGTVASVIWPLISGRDLTQRPRSLYAIDVFGRTLDYLRNHKPAVLQWLTDRVKPERDHNRDAPSQENWWVFARPRPVFRPALRGLARAIATSLTAKYRTFQYVDPRSICDSTTVMFALEDAWLLGAMSSWVHATWAVHAGGRLGVGDDPRYLKGRCFDPFPFPLSSQQIVKVVRELSEQLDAHRKRQQAQHPELTITGMYNVLEKLKSGEALSAKEKVIHEQGLVSVLKQLHDELDLAVLDAYGWPDLAPLMQVVNGNAAPRTNGTPATRDDCKRALDDALLERLVALNAERAAEEKKGLIRWLRPEFQNPDVDKPLRAIQAELNITEEDDTVVATATIQRLPWPKELPDQVRQVADVLATAHEPMSLEAIAARFTGKGPWKRRLPQIVETLETLGRARRVGNSLVGVG